MREDEGTLARRAAGGDGQAFAELYDQYEAKIFNFCLRLVGSRDDAADATQDAFVKVLQRLPALPADRELNFGAYLFTAARNASYDVIGKRKRADVVDEIPEHGAKPLMGDEVGDVLMDPERAAMMGSFQTAVQEANARLPERQREVLALRELDDLSYDEIGEILDMNRNAVAQLISRARIKLRDELRGSALASVAVSTPDCERALPLIAKRQDGQLKADADRGWLDTHLAGCGTCRVSVEAMAEAGASYRAWAPVIPMAWLWKSTAAKAMERTGFDWSDLLDRDRSGILGGDSGGAAGPAGAPAGDVPATAARGRRYRRAGVLLGALVVLLIPIGIVIAGDDEVPTTKADTVIAQPPPPPTTTTEAAPVTTTAAKATPRKHAKKRKTRRKASTKATGTPTTSASLPTSTQTQPAVTRTPTKRPKPSNGSALTSGGGGGSAGGSSGGGSTGTGSTGTGTTGTGTTTGSTTPTTGPGDYCAQNPSDPKCGGTPPPPPPPPPPPATTPPPPPPPPPTTCAPTAPNCRPPAA